MEDEKHENKIFTAYKFVSSMLKVCGPLSQNELFYSNDAPSLKKSCYQILVTLVKMFGYMKRLRIFQLPL